MSLFLFSLQRRRAKNGRFFKNISTTIGCLKKSTLNRVLVNDARNIRQCWILCNDEGCDSSTFLRFVFECISTRNVRSPFYFFKVFFVVTVISKEVYKLLLRHM